MPVQKIVVELHESLAQPFVRDDAERDRRITLASSAALVAAMSIPSLLFQAAYFPVHHPENAMLGKIATGGYGEHHTLRERWDAASEMLLSLRPYDTQIEAKVLLNPNGDPILGCHYIFMVYQDGRVACLAR
jgi:hypothetical protein